MKEKESIVTIKIMPPITIDVNAPREVKIELDREESTVLVALSKLYESCGIPQKIYDETLKQSVHVFWTRTLIKNGIGIGWFGIEGLELKKDSDSSVKGGDELAILLPAGGG